MVESLFNKGPISERVLFYELFVSFSFFKSKGVHFDIQKCFTELINSQAGYYDLLENNSPFFVDLFNKIGEAINETRIYKINFNVTHVKEPTIVYFTLIFKSVKIVESGRMSDFSHAQSGYTHRTAVVQNLKKMMFVYTEIEGSLNSPIKTNTLKLLIILSEHIKYKKINIKVEKKNRTDFYIGFNLIIVEPYINKIHINNLGRPYRMYPGFLVGWSHTSIQQCIKCGTYQNEKN